MATAAPLDLEASPDTECTVCHEQYTIPKLLPCGHLLCKHCLISWLKKQPEPNCPLCRYPIVEEKSASKSSSRLEDVADSLPTDLFMEARVEADRLLSKQHVCCVCVGVAAKSLCITCDDMFCQTCSNLHKKQSLSKHHQVEDLTSLTSASLAVKRPATCSVHKQELAKVHCCDHDVSVCIVCATTDHRECPNVVKLESKVEESVSVLKDLSSTLKEGEKKLNSAISEIDSDLTNLDLKTQSKLTEIEDLRQRLCGVVHSCCDRLKEKTMKTSSELKSKMVEGKNVLLKQRGRFTTHSQVVQNALAFSDHGSFSHMTSAMKTRVNSLDCSDDLLSGAKVKETFTMTFDSQVVTRIEQDLSHLGDVPCLVFHSNHGTRVTLSNNGQTVQRTHSKTGDGVVISREVMTVNMLYEVHIDAVNDSCSRTQLGVVTSSPSVMTLPSDSFTSHPAVLCVNLDNCIAFGQWLNKKWPVLKQVPVGTKVGLALDAGRSLHLFVNGRNEGVITSNIPDPCYFMFDLFSRCTKVTALPVTQVFQSNRDITTVLL